MWDHLASKKWWRQEEQPAWSETLFELFCFWSSVLCVVWLKQTLYFKPAVVPECTWYLEPELNDRLCSCIISPAAVCFGCFLLEWREQQSCPLITTWCWVGSDGRGDCLVNCSMYRGWIGNICWRPLSVGFSYILGSDLHFKKEKSDIPVLSIQHAASLKITLNCWTICLNIFPQPVPVCISQWLEWVSKDSGIGQFNLCCSLPGLYFKGIIWPECNCFSTFTPPPPPPLFFSLFIFLLCYQSNMVQLFAGCQNLFLMYLSGIMQRLNRNRG